MLSWPLTGRVNHKGDVAYGASPRTSTIDQVAGLQAQLPELAAVGCGQLAVCQLGVEKAPSSRWGPKVCRLAAGGNRIRTIGPALVKGLSAVAGKRCRIDNLDWVLKHRSSRETTMVGRGASLDDLLFLGGTDGSNPVPSSGESSELPTTSAANAPAVGCSLFSR